ncbi:MAG TPA: esterase-like activity of phytase family protein [Allosphingosinicella sp.]
MARWGRAGLAVLAFAALATPIAPGPPALPPGPGAAVLRAEPIRLNEDAPDQRQVGSLTFLAGWALTSDDRRFGSISAMAVEGDRVTAISDSGILLGFPVPGRGPARVEVMPLPAGPGSPSRKVDRDTEAMFVSGSRAWLAFENRNEVWRYARPGWSAEARAAPAGMRRWPANRGAEAMHRLADGRFLIISESLEPDSTSPALLFPGDPTQGGEPVELRFRPARDHRITDVAQLPDGRLLLLQRDVSLLGGVTAKISVVDLAALSARRPVEGREVAHFAPPLTVDNMEALSLTREGEQTIVWLASDDNYFPLQRTLLMKFALRE